MYFDKKVTHLVQKFLVLTSLVNPLFPFTAQSQANTNTSMILDTWKVVYATASNWTTKLQKEKINAKTSTLRLKILWPTNHNLVMSSQRKKTR